MIKLYCTELDYIVVITPTTGYNETTLMQFMITNTLQKLGYSEKEVKVYLTVVQYGKMTPVGISRITKINRTTVYTIANELVRKGLLVEDIGDSIQTFIARSPNTLQQIMRREEEELEEKKRITQLAIAQLNTFSQAAKYQIPKVVFIEEDEIENHLYRQTPLWNASIEEKETEYWGFQDASFITYFEKWIDWYWADPSSKNISLKLLSNEHAENIKKKKFSQREIMFWNKTQEFTATTWVMGDYIVMIITSESPHYLVEIHDKTLAHNMREVFKGIWEDLLNK